MGHAIHFLERLERLSVPHAELALGLYRDAGLVKGVLAMAASDLPQSADRVALSLSAEPSPPYLVVTRDGRFVTCLGAGMRPSDATAVLSYPLLEKYAASLDDLRTRMREAARSGTGPTGFSYLLRQIFESGAALSRERWLELNAFRPLIENKLYEWLVMLVPRAWRDRWTFDEVFVKANPDHLRGSQREVFEHYWQRTWALGHLSTLLAPVAAKLAEDHPDREALAIHLAVGPSLMEHTPLLLRACYLASCAGKPVLHPLKREYLEPRVEATFLPSLLSLYAMGLQHTGMQAEILKCLAKRPAPGPNVTAVDLHLAEHLFTVAQSGFHNPRAWLSMGLERGRELYHDWTSELPGESNWRFASAQEVPEELAFAALCNVPSTTRQGRGILDATLALTWCARRGPEEMHLPEGFFEAAGEALSAEKCAPRLAKELRPTAKPVVKAERTAPNAACPCGSGKKFKRCCGLGREAAKAAG